MAPNGPVDALRMLARGVLDESVDLLEACIDIDSLLTKHFEDVVPSDVRNVFVWVASELDAHPIGSARQHWEPAALARHDAIVDVFRRRVEEQVKQGCRDLLGIVDRLTEPDGPRRSHPPKN